MKEYMRHITRNLKAFQNDLGTVRLKKMEICEFLVILQVYFVGKFDADTKICRKLENCLSVKEVLAIGDKIPSKNGSGYA